MAESKCKTCPIRKQFMDFSWSLLSKVKPAEEGRYLVKFKNGYRATARWHFVGKVAEKVGAWYSDDDDIVMLTTVLKWMNLPR